MRRRRAAGEPLESRRRSAQVKQVCAGHTVLSGSMQVCAGLPKASSSAQGRQSCPALCNSAQVWAVLRRSSSSAQGKPLCPAQCSSAQVCVGLCSSAQLYGAPRRSSSSTQLCEFCAALHSSTQLCTGLPSNVIERHWRFLGRGDVAAASRDRRSPKRRPALLAQVCHQRKERLQIAFGDRVHELAQPFPICDVQAFPWTPNWRRNRRAPPAPPPTNNRVATTPLRIINTALRRQGPHGCRRTRTRPCREGLRPRPTKKAEAQRVTCLGASMFAPVAATFAPVAAGGTIATPYAGIRAVHVAGL